MIVINVVMVMNIILIVNNVKGNLIFNQIKFVKVDFNILILLIKVKTLLVDLEQ